MSIDTGKYEYYRVPVQVRINIDEHQHRIHIDKRYLVCTVLIPSDISTHRYQ
jgi:hypothetical protein